MYFDAENYDVEQDRNVSDENSVAATVTESWVRRLVDVVRLAIGRIRLRRSSFNEPMRDVFDVGDVSLTFSDGAVAELSVDQVEMTRYDEYARSRADGFIDALRKHTGL